MVINNLSLSLLPFQGINVTQPQPPDCIVLKVIISLTSLNGQQYCTSPSSTNIRFPVRHKWKFKQLHCLRLQRISHQWWILPVVSQWRFISKMPFQSLLSRTTPRTNFIRLSCLEIISKMKSCMLKVNWIVPTRDKPIKRARNAGLDGELS